jgi:hypothetical protein
MAGNQDPLSAYSSGINPASTASSQPAQSALLLAWRKEIV